MSPDFIPSHLTPTEGEYCSKRPSIQTNYVEAILQEASVLGNKYNVIDYAISGQETKLVETFFKNFPSFPPKTALAKLVQLLACEETLRIRRLSDSKDNFTGLKKTPPNKYDQAYLRASIRNAQEYFSKKFFGKKKAEKYLGKIRTDFFAHRSDESGPSDFTRRRKRNEQLTKLMEEINTQFPLTSR